MRVAIPFLVLASACGVSVAQPCDFASVTALCNGALAGQGVATPVPGFDVLLMHRGEVVYHQSFGAWSLDRVANADSSTKTLSGALMLSIAESNSAGFSLSSRLSDFVPQFAGLKTGTTIRQAFSHMAGFRESASLSSASLTLQQAALDIADDPQLFVVGSGFVAPGTAFSYGGTSMHAAGAVAEIVGGAPWNVLFSQRISGPARLNMPNTRFVLTTPSNPRIAGGCESTASEFGRFMETLRRGGTLNGRTILSPQSVQQMFTRQTPLGVTILTTPISIGNTDRADYGVGVWLVERAADGGLQTAIAAGARGFASWIDFDDEIVGVFATDLTSAQNVQPLYVQLFRAAEQVVRACPSCDSLDFNNDAFTPDSGDLDDFIAVLGGGPSACSTFPAPGCNDIDFNNDGVFPDSQDLDAFLSRLSGGTCP
jgi:CubicO group peptidase (beta-lactamase class C family)